MLPVAFADREKLVSLFTQPQVKQNLILYIRGNHPGNLVRNHEPFKLIFFLSAKAVPLKILQYHPVTVSI